MKKAVRVVLIALLAIIVVFAVCNFNTLKLTFYNLTVEKYNMPESDDWTGGKTYLNVPYSDVSPADYLDLYVPEGGEEAPKLFVIIHGGGFIAGDSQTRQAQLMYRYYRDQGYACATINYRLAQEAAFPAAIQDCKAAIRFLRANAEQYGYDAEQIVIFGESAGGYLATMCAFTTDEEFNDLPFIGQTEENNPSAKVDALVDYYPYVNWYGDNDYLQMIRYSKLFYDLGNSWMKGQNGEFSDPGSYWLRKEISQMSREELNVLDPYYYLEQNAEELSNLSIYLVHGDADITVPIPSSDAFSAAVRDALGENSIVYRIVPHMGHASDPLYSNEILADIGSWLVSE